MSETLPLNALWGLLKRNWDISPMAEYSEKSHGRLEKRGGKTNEVLEFAFAINSLHPTTVSEAGEHSRRKQVGHAPGKFAQGEPRTFFGRTDG
jgi:hypothetical protein